MKKKILKEINRRIRGWAKMQKNSQDSLYKIVVRPLVRIDELKDLRKSINELK